MGYDGTLKFDTSIDSSGFQAGLSKLSGLASSAIKATTAVIGGAASAVAGIGAAAIKVGSDFEAGMSKVQSISGASATEIQQLAEKAKEMGAKTKFSATESAEAFQYMAMAGWKTGDMLNSIEGIMNLAAASGEDLATTSDIVTDAMTAFGLAADGTTTIIKDGYTKEVSNATHFADVLAKAASNSNTNVGMMGETFKYVAPVAGALGFSVEDCATAIGLMANSGIKASQAGTSLRSIFSRMAKPTDEVKVAMDQLGVSLTNSDGSMKSLKEVMKDLRSGFAGLTEAQKAQMASALGGQEAMSGLLAIVNASDEDYQKLEDSIYDADGAAKEIYDYGVSTSKKRAVFDESGNHFYRDGYYVGCIGTNQWAQNNSHKGLVFDLEPQGKYMAFAQKASASASSYTTMLCFSRANSIYDEYGVNMGCNLIGNWYTLKNFKIGSISAGGYTAFSGAIPIVCEITNNGNSWTYSHLRVYNGIIVGYWN